jgi:hypothetical protein
VHLSLKTLLMEILLEASFGKKFMLTLKKRGMEKKHVAMATANAKPGERPYRITWFTDSFDENRHVDLTYEEMMDILKRSEFPPETVQRIKSRYPDSDLIGDEYTIDITSQIPARI